MKLESLLEKIVSEGLAKCISRFSGVSNGTWSLEGVRAYSGTLNSMLPMHAGGEGAGVYCDVGGRLPFAAMMVFDSSEVGAFSRCMTGCALPKGADISHAEELMLSELGSIVLNAVAGSFSVLLGQAFLPSQPKLIKGEPQFLLEALWSIYEKESVHRLVSVRLLFRCGENTAGTEVICVLSKSLCSEMERIACR